MSPTLPSLTTPDPIRIDPAELRRRFAHADWRVRLRAMEELSHAPTWVWDYIEPADIHAMIEDDCDIRMAVVGLMREAPQSMWDRLGW